jgi:RHS repeat-associated protein
VKNSDAKEVDSYDAGGHIIAQWQCTPLNCGSSWFNLGYSYNYAGGLISESTPMGFTLTPAYDPAARLKTLTSSWSDQQHPANLLTVDATAGYTPAGTLAKMTYGNGLVELNSYNNRLQPTQMRTYNPTTNTDVLNLSYGFTNSAGANNGNLVSFNSTATQIFMRSYTYDELNRLSTMSSPADASGCYGLTWTYDAWGNRLNQSTTSGTCGSPSHGVLSNNRLTDTGFTHDSAGNMTSDNIHGYAFNAESELIQVDSGSTATYLYDAGGQRVRKTTGGIATDYVYYVSGTVAAEIQGSTWTRGYVYDGSNFVAQYNGAIGTSGAATVFIHKDHLGSTRILTTLAAGVSDSMDYLPYGELLSGGSTTTHKFTGKERDTESGLDDFNARFYSSSLGRFVSTDWSALPEPVPYADFGDPQSLNLYTYVRNLPTLRTDPDGHCGGGDGACDPHATTPTLTKEFVFAMFHPFDALAIGTFTHGSTNISTNAVRISTGLGLQENQSREGSEVNAMRHTVWQATITATPGMGAKIAQEVGNAHEENPSVDLSVRNFTGKGALDRADQTTDLLNNKIGQKIGQDHQGASMKEVARAALDYYHTVGLYVAVKDSKGNVSVIQQKLTDAEYNQAVQNLSKMDENGYKPGEKKKDDK